MVNQKRIKQLLEELRRESLHNPIIHVATIIELCGALLDEPELEMEFVECDTCIKKPGSPYLCAGCLHNQAVIGRLKR